jgi:hypothetical protein
MEQDKDEQKEYWTDYLKGLEGGTRFPTVSNNREHTTGNLYHASFPKELTRQLQEFVKESKLTKASLLFSAWGLLLQRYTNNDDVLFGTTVSGRSAKIKE